MKNKTIKAMVLSTKKRVLFLSVGIIIAVPLTMFTIFAYNFVKQYYESEVILLNAKLDEEKKLKEDALSQVENVIKIRNAYRSNVKEIVELIYDRDTHLGVGGETIPVENSDEAKLLQMKVLISSMKNDLELMSQVKQYLTSRREFIDSFPFIWPVEGGVPNISSAFGFRYDPLNRTSDTQYHAGIDIPGENNSPIIVTADGTVVAIYEGDTMHESYGNMVAVKHKNGFLTIYGHLNKVGVKLGQKVEKRDVIGFMGNTGNSTGIHLHYEVRHNNVAIDPMTYLSVTF